MACAVTATGSAMIFIPHPGRARSPLRDACSACFALFVALLTLGYPLCALSQQAETTTSCEEGVVAEPVALAYGNSTLNCTIDSLGDNDRFQFTGAENDLIRLNLLTLSNGLDAEIEIRDGLGAVVAGGSCTANVVSRCSFEIELTLGRSGEFLVRVSDTGTDNTGGFRIQLERLLPAPPGTSLQYGQPLDDTLAPSNDTDFFHFEATAGTSVRLNLLTLSNDLDATMAVRDPTGAIVASNGCVANVVSRCAFSELLEPALSGTYTLVVNDDDWFNAGAYELSLWCLYGACDDAPVPDPGAEPIGYDKVRIADLATPTARDAFTFEATAGTATRFVMVTTSNDFDPHMQIRDPAGLLVVDGLADGAGCNANVVSRCSFSLDFEPAQSGTYAVLVFDDDLFNSGGFHLSHWCLFGPCDGAPTPDPDGPVIDHVLVQADTIAPVADADFYAFHGVAGTTTRLVFVTNSNDLDPRIEVRDPSGILVVDGLDNGGGCDANSVSRCSFAVELNPAATGTYAVLVYDDDGFNPGAYQYALWCVAGDCDSDADGFRDGDHEVLDYDTGVTGRAIEQRGDADHYRFRGTVGDNIEFALATLAVDLDPRIEVRDPSGELVINGIGDGGGCDANVVSTCSFTLGFMPALDGEYSLLVYDNDAFNSGGYTLNLNCIFGTGPGFSCANLDAVPFLCSDNCSLVANPAQTDTNADGYGNACDPDYNADGTVNFLDLALMRAAFFQFNDDVDLTGDGFVNFLDLAVLRSFFFGPAGPSCAFPNSP